MKITKIFATSVLATAVLLSGTACSPSAPSHAENSPTVAQAPSQKNSSSTTADTSRILRTVNGYYDFITSSDTREKVRSAGSGLVGKQATDDELQSLVNNFSEGFQYFDTSSSQRIKNAYTVMSVGSMSLAEQGSIHISAPKESITVNGDTATINTTWISVSKNGNTLRTDPQPSPEPSDLINLVKKDDGSWVIVPSNSIPKPTVP